MLIFKINLTKKFSFVYAHGQVIETLVLMNNSEIVFSMMKILITIFCLQFENKNYFRTHREITFLVFGSQ